MPIVIRLTLKLKAIRLCHFKALEIKITEKVITMNNHKYDQKLISNDSLRLFFQYQFHFD